MGRAPVMVARFLGRCGVAALLALASTTAAVADNTGSTNRLVKISIPGNPLRAFDIGWVDPALARYYLADRSNGAIDIFSTQSNSFVGRIGGFVGATGSNNTSGPNGVVVTFSGRELWAGDGNST